MARDRGVDDLGGKITHGEFTSNRRFLCNVLPLERYAEKLFSGLDALIALAPTRRSHTSSAAWLEGNRALVEPLSMLIPALETWHEPTVTRLFVSLFFFSAGC